MIEPYYIKSTKKDFRVFSFGTFLHIQNMSLVENGNLKYFKTKNAIYFYEPDKQMPNRSFTESEKLIKFINKIKERG